MSAVGGETHNLLINLSEMAITYFVPAVVWVVLMAGIGQLIREKIRQTRLVRRRFRRLVREGVAGRFVEA